MEQRSGQLRSGAAHGGRAHGARRRHHAARRTAARLAPARDGSGYDVGGQRHGDGNGRRGGGFSTAAAADVANDVAAPDDAEANVARWWRHTFSKALHRVTLHGKCTTQALTFENAWQA
jgi:hypothetical protein